MSLFGNTQASGTTGGFGAALQRSSTLPGTTAPPKLSLFGTSSNNTTQANTSGSSLFGTSTTQPQQQPTGLFRQSTAQPQQQQTGGLFGQNNVQQQQQPTGGLFGNTNSQQQSSSFLAPTQGNTGGLFGSSTGQNAQTQSSQPFGASSLFTSTAGAQSINQPLSQSQAQGTSSSYFDQMLERGKKRDFTGNGGAGDLPRLHLGLTDIARKARNLGTGGPSAADAQAGTTDARAHYLLSSAGVSTANASKDLNSFTANTGGNIKNSGSYADHDLDLYVSNLRTRSTMEMIQESMEQSKRDFDNFLEETVQMNWDAQRLKIYEHFGLGRPSESSGASIGASQSTRGAFGKSARGRGLGASSSTMAFGASGMHKSVLGNSSMRVPAASRFTPSDDTNAGPRVHMEDRGNRERQEAYAKVIQEFNSCRSVSKCFPLLHQLSLVESSTGAMDGNKKALSNSYRALVEVVEERVKSLPRSNPDVRSWERKYANAYLDDNPNSSQSIDLRKGIINGAQKCLENVFWNEKVETEIVRYQKDAQVGGVPSLVAKIRGFVRVKLSRNELVQSENYESELESLQKLTIGGDTDYCWVMIYFMLRSGLVKEAAQYVTENNRAIRSLDRNFSRYIEAYAADAGRKLPTDLRQAILAEYRTKSQIHSAAQTDPYKLACYKIIGRCELSKKSLDRVPLDQEDWIWLQFALAREVNRAEEAAGDAFGLEQLQTIVKDIGQRHFSSGSDNVQGHGIYFFLQVLAGMYEPAVKWLYDFDYVAAVHFSIALSYYGLLRVADLSTSNILSYTSREQPRLQFALMVGYYTAEFRAAKPEVATDYLVLLSLNADLPGEAGRQQAQLCLDALRELVLETREFAQLLGDIQSDGQRLEGAIQSRRELIRKAAEATNEASTNEFIHKLTIQAAQSADEAGRTTDSVLLYHLAGEFDNVMTIVNRALSEALTVELGQQAMRLEPLKPRKAEVPNSQSGNLTLSLTSVDDPVILANNIRALYLGPNRQEAANKIKTSTREATDILLRMADAKAHLSGNQFNKTIDIIGNMHILPLDAGNDVSKIRQSAQNFNSLVPVVARCIGDLIIWTVWACTKEKERLTRDGWETDGRRRAVEEHNTAIRDLNIFAGLVRYKLRQDVFEVLAKAGESSV